MADEIIDYKTLEGVKKYLSNMTKSGAELAIAQYNKARLPEYDMLDPPELEVPSEIVGLTYDKHVVYAGKTGTLFLATTRMVKSKIRKSDDASELLSKLERMIAAE